MSEEFPPRKLKAIQMLAEGCHEYKAVAEACNINVMTLRRWRQDPEFQTAVREAAYALFKDHIPTMLKVLFDQAEQGSYVHLKLAFERLDKMEITNRGVVEVDQDNVITFQFKDNS